MFVDGSREAAGARGCTGDTEVPPPGSHRSLSPVGAGCPCHPWEPQVPVTRGSRRSVSPHGVPVTSWVQQVRATPWVQVPPWVSPKGLCCPPAASSVLGAQSQAPRTPKETQKPRSRIRFLLPGVPRCQDGSGITQTPPLSPNPLPGASTPGQDLQDAPHPPLVSRRGSKQLPKELPFPSSCPRDTPGSCLSPGFRQRRAPGQGRQRPFRARGRFCLGSRGKQARLFRASRLRRKSSPIRSSAASAGRGSASPGTGLGIPRDGAGRPPGWGSVTPRDRAGHPPGWGWASPGTGLGIPRDGAGRPPGWGRESPGKGLGIPRDGVRNLLWLCCPRQGRGGGWHSGTCHWHSGTRPLGTDEDGATAVLWGREGFAGAGIRFQGG
ncbi:translation initiation factor IF-2-like [Onychostruthus taczanowskii]|uniref:translation initiation factor IF-2-like n=1 Tax=Onychostruthus taczanowskii TaxID=356909 RepID=UPI001B80D83B|nr:translation initiation factor IF-2-like [Onychostruthus taczanowskii]